jgi:hypothetical protein
MKRDYFFLILITAGIWTSIVMVFGIWEFEVLKVQVQRFQIAPIDKFIFQPGVLPYISAIISWTLLLLANGLVWSQVLFPARQWVEKVIFALATGVAIMPLSFMIPFLLGTGGRVVANLLGLEAPKYVDAILKNHVFFLVNNHEQVYELVNVLVFLAIGLLFLVIKSILRKQRQAIPQN